MQDRFQPSLGALFDHYDGFILDMWGVIHDGITPYPGVIDCLQAMRRAGKRSVILSNGPRRARDIAARAAEMGIDPTLFDGVMSSGEDAWRHLRDRHSPSGDPWYRALSGACYHLGPERDRGMLEGLDLTLTDAPDGAGFILNTGAIGYSDELADYRHILDAGLVAGVPMICANPDLTVMRGDAMEICAGTLAADYEARGGSVRYHGKPHPSVYEPAFQLLGIADRSRVLMVGDGLRTDILGANRIGFDSALIPGGLHSDRLGIPHGALPDPATLEALCKEIGAFPRWVVPGLIH